MQVLGYVKGSPVSLDVITFDGVLMSDRTAWAYYYLLAAAWQDGIRLKPTSGWRSNEEQTTFFNMPAAEKKKRGIGAVVAKPGYSLHQSGKAIDIDTKGDPRVLPWLRANAGKFGFFETVSSEPWHWEYAW